MDKNKISIDKIDQKKNDAAAKHEEQSEKMQTYDRVMKELKK